MGQVTQNQKQILYQMPLNGHVYYLRSELKDVIMHFCRHPKYSTYTKYGGYANYKIAYCKLIGLNPVQNTSLVISGNPIYITIPPGPKCLVRWTAGNCNVPGYVWLQFRAKENKGYCDIQNIHISMEIEEFNKQQVILEKV